MFIPKRIFLYGILALIISLSYLPLYIRTRKAEELKTSCRKYFPAKLLLCYVFNILVSQTGAAAIIGYAMPLLAGGMMAWVRNYRRKIKRTRGGNMNPGPLL